MLHDYGHFILENPDGLVSKGMDGKHEEMGYEFLKEYFIKDVVEPIQYHVKAKRYLARDKSYYSTLSKASKVSLNLQGGIFDDKDAKEFENTEFFESAIKLRKFDENAKRVGLKIKSINDYKNLLISKLI